MVDGVGMDSQHLQLDAAISASGKAVDEIIEMINGSVR